MILKIIFVCISFLLVRPVFADTLTLKTWQGVLLPEEMSYIQPVSAEDNEGIIKYLRTVAMGNVAQREILGIWYQFPIENTSTDADTLYFESLYQYDTFWFFSHGPRGLAAADTTGYWTNPFYRLFPEHPFIGSVILPPGKSMVYFGSGIYGENTNYFNVRFHDKTSIYTLIYKEKQTIGIQMLINTLSLGFMAFIFLFFLLYALLVRESIYISYAIYLFFALAFCITMWNDLPSQAQVWSNYLFQYRYLLNETMVAWMFAAYVIFTDRLLTIAQQSPWFGKILKIQALVLFLYGLWHMIFKMNWWYPEIIEASYFYFRIIFMPNYVIMLILILVKIRSPLKVFFMLASISLLLGVVASIMVDLMAEVWVVNGSIIHPGALLQIGIIFETIFFSLALGYKNKLIYDQRDQHKRQYIDQLKENNRLIVHEKLTLENKVAEAKTEILEKQAQIEARKIALLQAEFENKIQELTIQSLEAQMNPHFLFNGLSAVRDLVMKNRNDEATKYINTFALLLRNSLNNNRKQSISLQEEIQDTVHYLQIEKLRFGSSFKFSIVVDPDVDINDIDVPPKLLQPIAENCIKHGLRHSKENKKKIQINVCRIPDGVHIFIEDNGIGLVASRKINEANQPEITHLGLKLLTERLVIFNQQHDIKISMGIEEIINQQMDLTGTRVSFMIVIPAAMVPLKPVEG